MIQITTTNFNIQTQDELGEGTGGLKSSSIEISQEGDGSGGAKAISSFSAFIKKIPKTLKGKRERVHNSCNHFYSKEKYRNQKKDISYDIKSLTKF